MARKQKASLNMAYQISDFVKETALSDKVAALAFFLLDNVGTVCGRWAGHMSANDQRALFGQFVGKGTFVVNGAHESVDYSVAMAFGTMRDTVWFKAWKEI